MQQYANQNSCSLGQAIAQVWRVENESLLDSQVIAEHLAQADQQWLDLSLPLPSGVASRTRSSLANFWQIFITARQKVESEMQVEEILQQILGDSGYYGFLQMSKDPQDAVRLDNLQEFYNVAKQFSEDEPEGGLVGFLERVALVADADQIGDEGSGEVTLMTVHTAKGLEYPVVFVTGLEEGIFPHMRSLEDPIELEEERRLAYVAVTRAREKLFLTAAASRTAWGQSSYHPLSPYLSDIPAELYDLPELLLKPTGSDGQHFSRGRGGFGSGSTDSYGSSWRGGSQGKSSAVRRSVVKKEEDSSYGSGTVSKIEKRVSPIRRMSGSGISASASNLGKAIDVAIGDAVNHNQFGLGKVTSLEGSGKNRVARVDFGDGTEKRLLLRLAPMEKI